MTHPLVGAHYRRENLKIVEPRIWSPDYPIWARMRNEEVDFLIAIEIDVWSNRWQP